MLVLFEEKILIFHVKENNNLILKNKLVRKEKKKHRLTLKVKWSVPNDTDTKTFNLTRHHKVLRCRYNKTATTDVFLNKYT